MPVPAEMNPEVFATEDETTAHFSYREEGDILTALGSVDKIYSFDQKFSSELKESPFRQLALREFPEVEITEVPAILSREDDRWTGGWLSPLMEGVRHHGHPMLPFPEDLVQEAICDYAFKILAYCQPNQAVIGKLTLEQAVMGIDGDPYIRPIEWQSSSGWPLRAYADEVSKPFKKISWVKVEEIPSGYKFLGLNDKLEQEIQIKREQRKNSVVPVTIFCDMCKDELVEPRKLVPGGTRVVSMSPLDFTIEQRINSMHFVSSFMTHRLELEHMVGVNPDSMEWRELKARLIGPGFTKFIAADYSKFGDKLPVEIGHQMYALIGLWYEKNCQDPAESAEIKQTLKIMAYEVFNAKHIAERTVYQTHCGMPSGNSLTVILNSMVNSVLIRLAWLTIMRDTEYAGLDRMALHTRLFTYGDDIIMGVSDVVCEKFNTITLHEFFESYGMKFTDFNKAGELVKYRPLEECMFLQRGFVEDTFGRKKITRAPIRETTLVSLLHWIGKSKDDLEMAKVLALDAIRLSFTRGKKYYDWFVKKVNKILAEFGFYEPTPSWDELAVRVYCQGELISEAYRLIMGRSIHADVMPITDVTDDTVPSVTSG
nr:polyprotein [Picornavirales sp.]